MTLHLFTSLGDPVFSVAATPSAAQTQMKEECVSITHFGRVVASACLSCAFSSPFVQLRLSDGSVALALRVSIDAKSDAIVAVRHMQKEVDKQSASSAVSVWIRFAVAAKAFIGLQNGEIAKKIAAASAAAHREENFGVKEVVESADEEQQQFNKSTEVSEGLSVYPLLLRILTSPEQQATLLDTLTREVVPSVSSVEEDNRLCAGSAVAFLSKRSRCWLQYFQDRCLHPFSDRLLCALHESKSLGPFVCIKSIELRSHDDARVVLVAKRAPNRE